MIKIFVRIANLIDNNLLNANVQMENMKLQIELARIAKDNAKLVCKMIILALNVPVIE